MERLQFRVLYREFLFRMVDLEVLSADALGDANKLLGQLAALLTLFSVGLGLGGLLFSGRGLSPVVFRTMAWSVEHFLISTTMLVVGLFAVLSWDSTFPGRRDVFVLAPLPIRNRTLFLAKVAAVASGLLLTIVVLNAGPGLTWPITLTQRDVGFLDLALPFTHRTFFAYWGTMLAAGTFLFCCVLATQGLAALLPRRIFLALSAVLQVAAFCLFVSVYFLEPSLMRADTIGWYPSWWFLGLFQQLNGTSTLGTVELAHRAWMGLAAAVGTTALAYVLSYFRTLRKIVEEPDIAPGARGWNFAPRFGSPVKTAIVQFSVRALLRSRQHRVILAFYLGVGFAVVILFAKSPEAQEQLRQLVNAPFLIASVVMLWVWILGARSIFGIPIDPRANWIFRTMPIRGGAECLSAARWSLYLLAVAPAMAASAAWFLWIWPSRAAWGHLTVLLFLAVILAELCLYGFEKIPFTCSWLPGKSRPHLLFWGGFWVVQPCLVEGAKFESRALGNTALYAKTLASLVVIAVAARVAARARSGIEAPLVQFEETETPAVQSLGLIRYT
jgi:hypothetical protein